MAEHAQNAAAPAATTAAAPQAQQPYPFDALPDALVLAIMRTVWDARPALTACCEVRLMLALESLSRRFKRLLRALRLRLDFSGARLAQRHLDWLVVPQWTNRAETLILYNWLVRAQEMRGRTPLRRGLCTDDDVASPLLAVLRANQRGSLRRLLGMPLRLSGIAGPVVDGLTPDQALEALPSAPYVDLAMFRLTELGVPGGCVGDRVPYDVLPRSLVTWACRAAFPVTPANYWEHGPAAQAALWLPSLRHVRLCGHMLRVNALCLPALAGWHGHIDADQVFLEAQHKFSAPVVRAVGLFPGAREVRIGARVVEITKTVDERESDLPPGPVEAVLQALVGMLCPPGLECMEIDLCTQFPSGPALEKHLGTQANRTAWQWVMRDLIEVHAGDFAFHVDDGLQKRVAWRRWPAPGTPAHQAASGLHARAAAWAAF